MTAPTPPTLPDLTDPAWDTTSLYALQRAAAAELERRERNRRAEDVVQEVARRWHEDNPAPAGESGHPVWVRPTGAHNVYPVGSVVEHEGRIYRADGPTSDWEPGAVHSSGWTDITPTDPDAGPLPWAEGQDVVAGDERTHDGRLWRAKIDHRTHSGWAPSIHTHAVWEDLGPA